MLAEELALCWVHEGRRSEEKLLPSIPYHQTLLEAFVQRLLGLLCPGAGVSDTAKAEEEAAPLERRAFEAVFTTVTGYNALDERIAKTHAKKGYLLMVLAHLQEIPLHNNPAELGARARDRETGCELRAAHLRRRPGLGHLHDAGGDRNEAGSQFLSLHS